MVFFFGPNPTRPQVGSDFLCSIFGFIGGSDFFGFQVKKIRPMPDPIFLRVTNFNSNPVHTLW